MTPTRRTVLAGGLAAALGAAAGPAAAGPRDDRARIDVASYNLYLGAPLAPLLAAASGGIHTPLPVVVDALWATVQASQPEARMAAVADILARSRPDLIGLQEVALWRAQPTPGAPLETRYDFLRLLLDALRSRGLSYRAVATIQNFAGALPTSTGALVSFADRDVTLVRNDVPARHLSVDPDSVLAASFSAAVPLPPLGGAFPSSVLRGWTSVDATVRGFTFRFVNTHLEAFGAPVRNAQAVELAAVVSGSPHPVVLVGDVNAEPPGCGGDSAAFGILLAAGLREAWQAVHPDDPCGGPTSGQAPDLRNPVSTLTRRIDGVFFDDDALTALRTEVVGDETRERTPSGLWPSDHGGVVAALRTVRP